MKRLDRLAADAVLGIDTLWGGDVMCPSGTGRFIADSWFSDEPLPPAYSDPTAARVRESGGVAGKSPDREAIQAYLRSVKLKSAVTRLAAKAATTKGSRGAYLQGLAESLVVMWDLAMELLGKGEPVPYERCVRASTGGDPQPSDPASKRRHVAELLAKAGQPVVDARRAAGRGRCLAPRTAGATQVDPCPGRAFIAELDALTRTQRGAPPAGSDAAPCRVRTSAFCRSRTPGSRAR